MGDAPALGRADPVVVVLAHAFIRDLGLAAHAAVGSPHGHAARRPIAVEGDDRDAQQMRAMAPLIEQYEAWVKRQEVAGGVTPALADFRWRLEELRVSLFAQELKTPEPVSIKRLEKLWAELRLG